ncbi:MAG: hypothetical protein ACI91O_001542 [Candidatus Poriferisodalaceae bacterium]|jgi:hypothetical protein
MATVAEQACKLPSPRLPKAPISEAMQASIDKGADPVALSQFGHKPELMANWGKYYQGLLHDGDVEMRTKEIARLRVATLNDCHL